jgi:hypothetical protein
VPNISGQIIAVPNSCGQIDADECTRFTSARYISAPEAICRIFHQQLHSQYPNTVRLQVHTENCQFVLYKLNQAIDDILLNTRETTLTQYFKLNETDIQARQFLYHDLPRYYTWVKKEKKWKKRKYTTKTIGRMVYVNPKDTERFSLRTLLLHRNGATSFNDLKTVDGKYFKKCSMF